MIDSIEKFLQEENPALYDFKNQYQNSNEDNDNSIRKYFLYKLYSRDCDKCQLAYDIYNRLWGWPLEVNYNYRLVDLNNSKVLLGTETINSFWTTYKVVLQTFYHDYKDEFHNQKPDKGYRAQGKVLYEWLSNKEQIKEVEKKIIDKQGEFKIYEELCKFSQLTHSIGNFTLIPVGFNAVKGTRWDVQDYFDLFLHKWKTGEWMIDQNKFKPYLKKFLLEDYCPNNEIISLFRNVNRQGNQKIDGHSEIIDKTSIDEGKKIYSIKPSDMEELYNYLYNVNHLIEERGKKIVKNLKK